MAVQPEPSSRLAQYAEHVLQPLQRKVHEGSVVLIYGGYNTLGQEFGVDHFEVGHDCRTVFCQHVHCKPEVHCSWQVDNASVWDGETSSELHHSCNSTLSSTKLVSLG